MISKYTIIKEIYEAEMVEAIEKYIKACKSEAHSNSVKRGIKAAKEHKARLAEREVNSND